MRSISKILNKNRAELTKIDEDIVSLRLYFEVLTFADVVESNIDHMIEIHADSLKGFCSERALSKDFLVEHLQILEANKVGLGPVFGSWEWTNYYKNKMCTAALDKDILWVTIRIPLVKKSEKLIRSIPNPATKEILTRVSDYGLDVAFYKEKSNDKYHVITQSAFDLCNQLGNTRTCGVRDIRFSIVNDIVIPVEFALNRILVTGTTSSKIKVMSKCPNGITEHSIEVDSVWTIPNNCSYSSSYLAIEAREADVEVTSEVGIIHVDKFEFTPVSNLRLNSSKLMIDEVFNKTSSRLFSRNRNEIQEKLANIESSHANLLSTYSVEKWIFSGGVVTFVVLCVAAKLCFYLRKRRLDKRSNIVEFEMKTLPKRQQKLKVHNKTVDTEQTLTDVHDKQQQQQQQQQRQQLHQQQQLEVDRALQCALIQPNSSKNEGHVYVEIADSGNVSFSSRPELSQFYSK